MNREEVPMTSILLAAVLSGSSGQVPWTYPTDYNPNIYAQGYPYGGYWGGAGGSYGQPIIVPPGYSLIKNEDKNSKAQREIQRQLEEIKGALEDDVKGSLDKLNRSLYLAQKRLEASEKASLGTEARVKWLEEEFKQRMFWHDMENKLDHRIKPLEEKVLELNKILERNGEVLRRIHEEPIRRQKDVRSAEAGNDLGNDGSVKSLESKSDRTQGCVVKDISTILLRIEEIDGMLKEEKAVRQKMEDRLKDIERSLAPRGDSPKERENTIPPPKDNTLPPPQAKVTSVSLSQPEVPTNKALVIVSVPTGAKLYLNNQLTNGQGTTRSFVTPKLEQGRTYSYTFRMEVFQNGVLKTQTQQTAFQPGQRVTVVFGAGSEMNVAEASSNR
jgi:uncharacterized protein (TIGR03000 family)